MIQWRPGNSTGLPLILPESLPNAITEPEKVTAPISTPTYISISWIAFSAGESFTATAGSAKFA